MTGFRLDERMKARAIAVEAHLMPNAVNSGYHLLFSDMIGRRLILSSGHGKPTSPHENSNDENAKEDRCRQRRGRFYKHGAPLELQFAAEGAVLEVAKGASSFASDARCAAFSFSAALTRLANSRCKVMPVSPGE